jgi:signal peptidase I
MRDKTDPDSVGDAATNAESTNPESTNAEGTNAESSQPQSASADNGKSTKKKRKLSRELFLIVVGAVILTVLIKLFVVQVYEIPSDSMQNTLQPGDRVLVNKLIYHFRSIDRGDIIVFSGAGSWGDLEGNPIPPPSSNPVVRILDDALSDIGLRSDTTYYIKRVIGLPGDHVACCTDGLVTVNGVALHESSYLYPGNSPSDTPFHVTVAAGRLFVMGDHRDDSLDSRYQGTIPENEVVGRAFLIIWPPSHIGDLPIPATFKQAALASAPAAVPAGAAVALGTPLLIWRHRRKSRMS